MSPADERASRIALWNDRLRKCAPIGLGRYGMTVCTYGIGLLAPATQSDLLERIRTFDDFSEENDPYQERDFGLVRLPCGLNTYWKIDYYADQTCSAGAEDPADPEQCFRVLTIMLASEY